MSSKAHFHCVNNPKYLCRSNPTVDSHASMVASQHQFSANCIYKQHKLINLKYKQTFTLLLTWNSFKSLQYGSVRRQPITHAFKCGIRWQISNRAPFTVSRTVSTAMLYFSSHSRINSSISSNGLSGWMYKHSSFSFGYFCLNKSLNRCNNAVQSLPPLNDKNISFDSYVSKVLINTYEGKEN